MNKFKKITLADIVGKQYLLPWVQPQTHVASICFNCNKVNENSYNYCTNCGYPMLADLHAMQLYSTRLNERSKLILRCRDRIVGARNVLYICAAFCSLAALFFITDHYIFLVRGLVFIVLAGLFAGLARWSNYKPFTSLLISFVLMITLAALNTWAEVSRLFSTTSGLVILLAQLVFLYFVTIGVKAAYKADILDENCIA